MAYTREQLVNLVTDYAYGYNIDPAVAIAQIQRESRFNPNAVGLDGERGLAQILPSTWPSISDVGFDLAFDPDYNLTAWGNYMSTLLGMFGGDYAKALMAYNGGPRNVQRGTVSARAQRYAREILQNAGAPIPAGDPDAEGTWQNWLTIGLIGALVLLVAKR